MICPFCNVQCSKRETLNIGHYDCYFYESSMIIHHSFHYGWGEYSDAFSFTAVINNNNYYVVSVPIFTFRFEVNNFPISNEQSFKNFTLENIIDYIKNNDLLK